MDEHARNEILDLIGRAKTLIISAINGDGIPIIKAVSLLGNDGVNALYFCTSPKSGFCEWYRANSKTSALLLDDDPTAPYPSTDEKYYSLSLLGIVEFVTDRKTKLRFITDYTLQYWPDGVDDENYNLLRFKIESGKYRRLIAGNSLSLNFETELTRN